MRIHELFEKEVPGEKVSAQDHPVLYHLTDYIGFSHTVNTNRLAAFRQNYISTTYDAAMNSVGGRDHYHFKFKLNGAKLIDEFGGNYHKSFAQYTTGGYHDWDEREVAIHTRAIDNFSEYVDAVVIIINIYSRQFIQWMFYEIKPSRGFMGDTTAEAPKGIESLRKFAKDWNKQILVQQGGEIRELNPKEVQFINDCFKMIKRNVPFDKALYGLTQKYDGEILNYSHDKKMLTKAILDKSKYESEIGNGINDLIAEKPLDQIDPNAVRKFVQKYLVKLGFKDQAPGIMKQFEENNFFHPLMEPMRWIGLFRDLIDYDAEEFQGMIEYTSEELARRLKHFDPKWFSGHTKGWAR